ncbi:MAG: hypothetical protein EPN86_05390 [Nanoarchaeota archaeon]|nr:MAG: hypothetical protein EPN86_05390 [Nanoarchaeota archaeon]
MVRDLVRIIRDTETSLSSQPYNYRGYQAFTRRDEEVLAEFLKGEREANPAYLSFGGWPVLLGDAKRHRNPADAHRRDVKKMPVLEKKLRSLEIKLRALGADEEMVHYFGSYSLMARTSLGMTGRLYELIVANTKLIAQERTAYPIEVASNPNGRDETYRRIFPQREQFEAYHQIGLETSRVIFDGAYSTFEKVLDEMGRAEANLFTRFLKRRIEKAAQKLPPRTITNAFFDVQARYDVQRADQIYGNGTAILLPPGKPV